MASKIEQDLEQARALVVTLERKLTEQNAATIGATVNMRELAISIHGSMCPYEDHSGDKCGWAKTSNPDSPTKADWASTDHQLWLKRAILGVENMRELGFIVTDPEAE